MRTSLRSAFVASVLIALLAFPRPADAWGNTGHEAVACVAWKLLDQPTKDKIYALLQNVKSIKQTVTIKSGKNAGTTKTIYIAGFKDWAKNMPADATDTDTQHMYIFMRAATWPDSIKTMLFHGTDDPPANEPVPDHNIGFTDRNAYKYWHFVNKPLGTPQTGTTKPPAWKCTGAEPTPVHALPEASEPNAIAQINALATDLASDEAASLKTYDLIWLEHLVGDIHQPLHAAVRYVDGIPDQGGNCVAISVPADVKTNFVRASSKSQYPTELHAFWDDLPGIGGQMDSAMASQYAKNLTPAGAAANDLKPEDWANESFQIASKDAYATPIGPAFGSPKPYAISSDYYTQASTDAKERVALAGARLAKMLQAALK